MAQTTSPPVATLALALLLAPGLAAQTAPAERRTPPERRAANAEAAAADIAALQADLAALRALLYDGDDNYGTLVARLADADAARAELADANAALARRLAGAEALSADLTRTLATRAESYRNRVEVAWDEYSEATGLLSGLQDSREISKLSTTVVELLNPKEGVIDLFAVVEQEAERELVSALDDPADQDRMRGVVASVLASPLLKAADSVFPITTVVGTIGAVARSFVSYDFPQRGTVKADDIALRAGITDEHVEAFHTSLAGYVAFYEQQYRLNRELQADVDELGVEVDIVEADLGALTAQIDAVLGADTDWTDAPSRTATKRLARRTLNPMSADGDAREGPAGVAVAVLSPATERLMSLTADLHEASARVHELAGELTAVYGAYGRQFAESIRGTPVLTQREKRRAIARIERDSGGV